MNIFATSISPVESALALDDKRLNKMILESAQMLSTALRRHGVGNGPHYRSAYQNHPCTLWTGNTRKNYLWLCDHALAMCAIYSATRKRTHSCERVIQFCYRMSDKIKSGELKDFTDCTKINLDLPITQKYKVCLKLKWDNDIQTPTWKNRKVPDWR